jgi:CDP-glucose 4,6-dehydratase
MESDFWKDEKVLITGFEGFLGSNLSKSLISLGAAIFGLDIRVRRKETILTEDDYKKIIVIKGSVVDYKLIERVINKHKINVVFHLAAEAIVGKCRHDPLRTFSANIEGTWNVLEACRSSRAIRSVIVASSDKAYGSHKKLPYREEASLIANHPYDVSKSCADLIANTYFHTYGLPVAITRCGNIYGPGDFNFSRLIPDAMRSLALNKRLGIRSDGKFVRDYVYIDDIVAGYIRIAELFEKHKLSGEAFNLSDEKPISVIGLLKEINRLTFYGRKLKYKIMNTAKYEIKEQYLSSLKARRILGWKPENSLEKGLKKTMEWYGGNL